MKPITKTIIVVGHGSRMQGANQDFEKFVERFKNRLPGQNIKHGYVELAKPILSEALYEVAARCDEVIVLPLFLFSAGHVKKDIALMVDSARSQFPKTKFYVARPLGVHPNMVALISKRVGDVSHQEHKDKTTVVIVGRGTSDPDAISDFCKLVRLFEETSGYGRVVYSYVAIVRPSLDEVLERLVSEGAKDIIIQPYLFFPGILVQKLEALTDRYAKLYPWVRMRFSRTLGEDELIFSLLQERMKEL